jgi:spore maturation protein CgeB
MSGPTDGRETAPADTAPAVSDEEAAGLEAEAARTRAALLQSRLAEALYKQRYAEWKLASVRSRRGWRVASAVADVRRGKASARRLPMDLANALRRGEAPPEPRPVSAPDSAMGPIAIPDVEWPDGPLVRPDLTVATILDPFSEMAFRYEWRQVSVGPDDWRKVMERERPAFLFVESAWRGNKGAWNFAMTAKDAPRKPLRDLVAWCRQQGIPTVFWNKEDPPNYDKFLATAQLFDHVFTVDGDKLDDYRRDLGHDRVGVLPFGAQPRVHNPVNVPNSRPYDVAFAGTYFAEKHAARRDQMVTVLEPARDFGVHIFSRMGGDDPRYAFPDDYKRHIVGSLPYEQMLAAYRMYKVFLNVNSVTESPTMCARRVFELSACRTAVVSGWSRAIEEIFGEDRIAITRTPDETRDLVGALLANPELRDRQAQLAHRLVFAEHTFSHRVDTVLRTLGMPVRDRSRSISVLLPTNRPGQVAHAIDQVARQRHGRVQLVLLLHGLELDSAVVADKAREAGIADVEVISIDPALTLGACLNMGLAVASGDLVAKMDDDNLYGEHYLSDLATAFDYTDAGIVGKWAHYVHLRASGTTMLRFPNKEHVFNPLVQGGTILAKRDVLTSLQFDDAPRAVDTRLLRRAADHGIGVYAADRYNFVSVRQAGSAGHTWRISDAALLKTGGGAWYGDPVPLVMI